MSSLYPLKGPGTWVQVRTRLPRAVFVEVTLRAKAEGRSVSGLLRKAITDYLAGEVQRSTRPDPAPLPPEAPDRQPVTGRAGSPWGQGLTPGARVVTRLEDGSELLGWVHPTAWTGSTVGVIREQGTNIGQWFRHHQVRLATEADLQEPD